MQLFHIRMQLQAAENPKRNIVGNISFNINNIDI